MKKFAFSLIVMLLILACEAGVDINATCVMKHTGLVTRLQTSSNTIETAATNLSWTWVYGMPEGDGVIIERSLGAQYDSLDYVYPIESLMIYTDLSDTLSADMAVSYRLSLVIGTAVQYFDTVDFVLPSGQLIYYPDTEFIAFDSILDIRFAKLADYDTTSLELYQTTYNIPDTVLALPFDEILGMMATPVWSQTIADTIYSFNADTIIDVNHVFILKVSSSKNPTLGYITDTSVGLVVFKRY